MTDLEPSRFIPPGPAVDRPLRVLQVVQRFFPELGGLETHVAEVSRRLDARPDIAITVLTTDRSGELPRADTIDGYPVVRRRSWPRERDYYLSPGIATVIARGDWDVIHVQGVHTFTPPVAMLAALAGRAPYVLTFHSGGHSSAGRDRIRGTQWKVLAPLLSRAGQLIAVSRFERRRFAEATGIDPSRFVVIQNGGALPPVVGDVPVVPGRFLSSGRLEQYKGHHLAIQALPRVRRQIPDAHLVILGRGPYEQQLRDLAAEYDVSELVTFRHVPPDDRSAMARELAQAQLMVAFSQYEAHPVAIMEAVASGLPVLGFDIAGTGDLVEDGLVDGLAPDVGPEPIANAIAARLRADRNRPRVRPDFTLPTWETCADQLAQVYRRVAVQRVGRSGAAA